MPDISEKLSGIQNKRMLEVPNWIPGLVPRPG